MFYLKNQIIFILLICIFSNLISSLNGKITNNNQDEDTKTDSINDLTQDNLISRLLKKSYSNEELLNSLMNTDIQWEPVDLEPIDIDPSLDLNGEQQYELLSEQQISSGENKKTSANKKSMNYQLNKSPKRNSIYRPIRAQRCLKRGALCDTSNPVLNCCSHSVCRCNFFNDQCRCDRMSLLQKWG